MTVLLEVIGLEAGYRLPVLRGLTFSVHEDEMVVVFGLNGAGKTTTLNTIMGLVSPRAGSIRFAGREINGLVPSEVVRSGISMCPEGRLVFPSLSVADNLRLGSWTARRRPKVVEEQLALVFEYFPILAERLEQKAGTLSGGEQQLLAIGRALMSRPRLLLIDEASLGLSPAFVSTVFDVVTEINRNGTAILMVEQNGGILRSAHRVLTLEKGSIVFEGSPDEIRRTNLRDVYLGSAAPTGFPR